MIDTSCLANIFTSACWWQENKDQALEVARKESLSTSFVVLIG